ncbi:hypothetical protein JKF63_07541 [Porcisia hertigi]|uniref:Uncharacterized protein n=1 Tax=Porcisia hertigi TaxID=2761500 RepID=A0A836IEI8_9TRYP|nr:hypothetical protein JKF63_07541 [Porcisia hertigi]
MSGDVPTEAMPIKTEVSEDPASSMKYDSAPHSDTVALIADDERDRDAIEISDIDLNESFPMEPGGHDMLVGTASVLTSGEEMPPCLSAPYMDALLNTDPRIAFDALHIGVLRAIEAREMMSRSRHDYYSWDVPATDFVEHPLKGEVPFFTVPSMHPAVRSREPIERDVNTVHELLSHPTREALNAAIGADILEHLRFNRNTNVSERRRSKRASAAGGKG